MEGFVHMKKNPWKTDLSRFIELISLRLYSDPVKAGIRELITNSLDAKLGQVEIYIDYEDDKQKLSYSDSGIGIDPESFREIYGKIASGHKRRSGSRGIFGIGRMSLIAASKKGRITSFKDGKSYLWTFNKKGWSGPKVRKDLDKIGHGVYIEFEGLSLDNLAEIEEWIRKTFAIPILKKECMIAFNYSELLSPIDDAYTEQEPVKTKYGKVQFYTKEETDGILYICQKGILVREEPYTGLTAYINQDFLDIKTDREGFVNNEKYRYFRRIIKKELAKLRPQKSFEKMEVDFIRRLMKEFKRYWFTKAKKAEPILEKIELEFPETGKEIVMEEEPIVENKEMSQEETSHVDQPEFPELKKEIKEWDNILDESLPEAIPTDIKAVEMEEESSLSLDSQKPLETKTVEDEKVVKIKGAKPVDLGEDYPVIFFETDPFVLVFNTSHPVFERLIEKGKLSSAQLAVLFERMFEAAYVNKYPVESLEELKKRWKEVDLKLKKIFK